MRRRAAAILPVEGGFLMERLENPVYQENLNKLRLIGGGVEPGEHAADALVRELHEELGITITSAQLGRSVVMRHGNVAEVAFEIRDHGLTAGRYQATKGSDAVVVLAFVPAARWVTRTVLLRGEWDGPEGCDTDTHYAREMRIPVLT